jgi:hypothetical protein
MRAGVILLWVLGCSLPGVAQRNESEAVSTKPDVQIDLAPAEYMGLSRGARLSGAANVSLSFLAEPDKTVSELAAKRLPSSLAVTAGV